jgi:glycosyltransferase involved in cell wall biosynthesis
MISKRYAVFIPCYNAASTIRETLVSVKEAIANTGIDIPVFVYDDCSIDDSVDIVSAFAADNKGVILFRNKENSGERKTTNNAFKDLKNKADWIFIIHADDIVKNDWLTVLIGEIEKVEDRSCFTVWSSYDTFSTSTAIHKGDNSGHITHLVKDGKAISQYVRKISSSWHISGAALNVGLYLALDGFVENMPQYGDTDFFVRGLLAGYTDMYIARTLTLYRVSAGSVTGTSFTTNRDIREIYMLINRFQHLLTNKEIAAIYRLMAGMSGRRMIKWLLKVKLKPVLMNGKQFVFSILGYLRFSFSRSNK